MTWKFDRRGILGISKDDANEEELFEVAIEAGADNIEEEAGHFVVQVDVDALEAVRQALQLFIEEKRGVGGEKKWGEAEDSRPIFTTNEIAYLPQNPIPVADPDKARRVLGLLGDLEDHDDVQNVFCDADVPEEIMEQIADE